MAIKKSELYSSLWASADELRGGMDASQYKDYVLTMLFIKYISDKYKDKPYGEITIPQGASFDDMVNLIGNPEIGDKVNKQILHPIKEANRLNDFPDFNDETKLGKGKDLVDTVSNLIRIFNDSNLDFAQNSAEGDDLLGDAYEYMMRNFATESGKSKGQFYTPAEVSRILAKVIGISPENSSVQTTAHDPACGSGSLLLKVAEQAGKNITLYGQEKETTTANLAKMNMILHNNPTAEVIADNTLSRPAFKDDDGTLKQFDYIVANPPFSLKNWSNGVNIDNDEYDRFTMGIPPEKNGDYSWLLHIIKAMKTTSKAAVVLPHGVLFRGNAEGTIRKNILRKGYIKGIIGLPANLFYGTGIPACIIVLDKENAATRKGIFMLDASKGFIKDGNKNRLREQDIRKITDVFMNLTEIPKFSRMVSMSEIADEKNDYNLNIPRYIDTQEEEDLQDITAHLQGGIPAKDIDSLNQYWSVFSSLKNDLFKEIRPNYFALKPELNNLLETITNHQEIIDFTDKTNNQFNDWLVKRTDLFKGLDKGFSLKNEKDTISEEILTLFKNNTLINNYDMYQHFMEYWQEVMQDDFYTLTMDGWESGNEWEREIIKGKRGKDGKAGKDKEVAGLAGIIGKLIPPQLLIEHYFQDIQSKIQEQENLIETAIAENTEIEEENGGDEGLFSDLDKVNKANVAKLLKELQATKESAYSMVAEDAEPYGNEKSAIEICETYIANHDKQADAKKKIKTLETKLEKVVIEKYTDLSIAEIKDLVIGKKWIFALQSKLQTEQERISQNLMQRIKELAERYADTLLDLEKEFEALDKKVKEHLKLMLE